MSPEALLLAVFGLLLGFEIEVLEMNGPRIGRVCVRPTAGEAQAAYGSDH